ncbi:MAG: type II secretion system protein [Lachnospiraceae bacterium]|nr:type II secretion system protein [Lachnospiraceae bacterium]
MRKLKNNRGMTLAELLVGLGILMILSGVSFVAVTQYQKSLRQMERDSIAKEIFIAAQNHLAMAQSEGYLNLTKTEFGTTPNDSGKNIVYYYTVNEGSSTGKIFDQMLPFGSIDETVRTGGNYLIRYRKDIGQVLDVFYCSTKGTPESYNYTKGNLDYGTVMNLRDNKTTGDNKAARHSWDGESILGWYGGLAEADNGLNKELSELPKLEKPLEAPTIEIDNAERLSVKITDPNTNAIINGVDVASLRLIIQGKNAKHYITIRDGNTLNESAKKTEDQKSEYLIYLDDITTSNGHFSDLNRLFEDETEGNCIPGEDIKIQAVSFSNKALANVAYSGKKTTNSLFAKVKDGTAYIQNIRHLENLDQAISGVDLSNNLLSIHNAVQTKDMSWTDFVEKLGLNNTDSVIISRSDLMNVSPGFSPIELKSALSYDGKNHSITNSFPIYGTIYP